MKTEYDGPIFSSKMKRYLFSHDSIHTIIYNHDTVAPSDLEFELLELLLSLAPWRKELQMYWFFGPEPAIGRFRP